MVRSRIVCFGWMCLLHSFNTLICGDRVSSVEGHLRAKHFEVWQFQEQREKDCQGKRRTGAGEAGEQRILPVLHGSVNVCHCPCITHLPGSSVQGTTQLFCAWRIAFECFWLSDQAMMNMMLWKLDPIAICPFCIVGLDDTPSSLKRSRKIGHRVRTLTKRNKNTKDHKQNLYLWRSENSKRDDHHHHQQQQQHKKCMLHIILLYLKRTLNCQSFFPQAQSRDRRFHYCIRFWR